MVRENDDVSTHHETPAAPPQRADAEQSTAVPPRPRRRRGGLGLRVLRRTVRVLSTLLVTALVAGVLAAGVAWQVYDVRFMPVLTPSMTPVMPTGSLAVTRPIAPQDIQAGDIIAFRPPQPWTPKDGRPVLHRVLTMDHYAAGRVMQTKGDANNAPDPWKIDLSGPGNYAQVVKIVPHVGTAAQTVAHAGPLAVAGGLAGLFLTGWGISRLLPRRRARR